MTAETFFPLDIDVYFYDSFSYDSTDVLSWLTHLILAQWLNSFVTLFPHISYHSHDESNVLPYCHPFLPLWLLFLCSISIFPWLHYCAYWGCMSWLISDLFLTHIILHAGRIFQQWCHNHIICLVVETALHVYKGQFSPWLGQFTYHRNSSPVFIGFHQVKSNAWPPDLECQKLMYFGPKLTSSLVTSSTSRSNHHPDKSISSLHFAY